MTTAPESNLEPGIASGDGPAKPRELTADAPGSEALCPVCGRGPSRATGWCSGPRSKRHAAVNVGDYLERGIASEPRSRGASRAKGSDGANAPGPTKAAPRSENLRLSRKQAEILKWLHIERTQAAEENEPGRDGSYTTYDLHELITQIDGGEPGFKGWDRGSLSVTLTGLEKRGLVRRLPVTEHHLSGIPMPHWNPISGVGPYLPGRRKARFAWQITGAGFRALEAKGWAER